MKHITLKTTSWHNWEEGDCGKPIKDYYKKRFWKRRDRKRFLKNIDKLYGLL